MDELNLTEMSLLTDNRDVLCEELCKFVVEIRKTDKTQYPPRSIQLILCGLQRYISQERPQTSDPEFRNFEMCGSNKEQMQSSMLTN